MRRYFLSLAVLLISARAVFCSISVTELKVVDELRTTRSNFSSAEKIGFEVNVYNTEQTQERVSFTFSVKDPSGKTVLTQAGNSAPGNSGSITSSIRNIQASKFFTVSGSYSVTVTAKLGAQSVSQATIFRVTSPAITLSYPPNNSRELTDKPLTFRWVSAGSARYKFSVGSDQSFFNPIHTAETSALSYSYPINPANALERLVGSQVYYWKVEGLDASGKVISRANQPYSFSISQGASGASTLDTGISDISLSRSAAFPGHLAIDVIIENSGSRPAPPFTLSLLVNGLSIDPPKRVDFLTAGQKQLHTFQYKILNYSEPLICAAVIDIFDDNPRNNRLVKRIEPPAEKQLSKAKIHGSVSDSVFENRKISRAQVFYSGPKRGFANADTGGVYKIEDLPLGDYTLWAKAAGYLESDKKSVSVQKEISYTGINFSLSASTAPVAGDADLRTEVFNLALAWEKLKKKLRNSTLAEVEGLTPYSVNDKTLMESVINGGSQIIQENVE